MTQPPLPDPRTLAEEFLADLHALPVRATASIRRLRREYSRRLKPAGAEYVWAVTDAILPHLRRGRPERAGLRWITCELIANHRPTLESLDASRLETLGEGMESWDEVDGFARLVAGPAWLHGLIDDDTVHAWARSPDLWWRRAAVVSTVALNMRSQGGSGDTTRTLAVCELVAGDREVMVQKALSWALRELVPHNADAVAAFVDGHEGELSALAKREVRHKLATGLKNPRRGVRLKA